MEQQPASDEWLMGQVARGQRECLEPLVRRYASPLLTYIERMVGDRHQAEELFQDAFLAVWEKRRTYRFPRRFRSWLFAIATNRCRQAFRRGGRAVVVSLDLLPESSPFAAESSPADVAVATETACLVAGAVARLPAQQRTVLVLRNWNGLSFAEIAEIVGCAETTVRSHLHHALAGVRRFLEPRLHSGDLGP
jgi:RNA polymerase sigma-70 factor (ECF subfamily)